jgi:hypothetical protein
MTRDFERLTVGDLVREQQHNALSLPVFIGLLGELFWRIIAFVSLARVTDIVRLARFDAAVHATLLVLFLFIAFKHIVQLQSLA